MFKLPTLATLFKSKTPATEPVMNLSLNDIMTGFNAGGVLSASGVVVNQESAQRLAAVFACVRVLSQAVAQLSLGVFETTKEGSNPVPEDPLHTLLHDKPNGMMTSFVWRELMMGSMLTKGDHVSVLQRNGRYDVVGIYPVPQELVTIFRKDGKKYFNIRTSTGEEIFSDEDVLHFPCFSTDGVRGKSIIEYFGRDTIGQAIGTQDHVSRFFESGATLGSTLETEQAIEPTRQQELLDAFKKNFTGSTNANKTALLVQGLKFKPVTINNADAQLIENRKFQVSDIARLFGVPPHMIGDLEKATFSNIEHQSIHFVQYSLMSWLKRIEQEVNGKLFAGTRKFARFNVDSLLRGDFATRSEGYSKALTAGWITPNEVRALENLNRVEGGDTLRVPLNMTPAADSKPAQ